MCRTSLGSCPGPWPGSVGALLTGTSSLGLTGTGHSPFLLSTSQTSGRASPGGHRTTESHPQGPLSWPSDILPWSSTHGEGGTHGRSHSVLWDLKLLVAGAPEQESHRPAPWQHRASRRVVGVAPLGSVPGRSYGGQSLASSRTWSPTLWWFGGACTQDALAHIHSGVSAVFWAVPAKCFQTSTQSWGFHPFHRAHRAPRLAAGSALTQGQ